MLYFIYCCGIPYEPCSLPNEVLQDIVLFFNEDACNKFIDTSALFVELVAPQVKIFNYVYSQTIDRELRNIGDAEEFELPFFSCITVWPCSKVAYCRFLQHFKKKSHNISRTSIHQAPDPFFKKTLLKKRL
uniref:F-box domain-containing protein n=1 Tax=Ditylenchus dipsaci TaxID=166011 RepID=A0A915E4S7_9BILA